MITARLDELGVDYIEGGYPLSNPKDSSYFRAVSELALRHAKVAAFGMTRRRDVAAEDDQGMKALVAAGTPVVTIVGKSWDLHVREVLGVSLDENLRMIADSVAFCAASVPEVDLRRRASLRRLQAQSRLRAANLEAAADAGAAWIVLCDTNGGSLPEEIAEAVAAGCAGDCRAARHPHAQRRRAGRGQLAGRDPARCDARFRARSTASVSGAAMPTSAASSPTLRSSTADYQVLLPGKLDPPDRGLPLRL